MVLELVGIFERVSGVKMSFKNDLRRRLAETYANASRAEKLMGRKAEPGLEDMCRSAWDAARVES